VSKIFVITFSLCILSLHFYHQILLSVLRQERKREGRGGSNASFWDKMVAKLILYRINKFVYVSEII